MANYIAAELTYQESESQHSVSVMINPLLALSLGLSLFFFLSFLVCKDGRVLMCFCGKKNYTTQQKMAVTAVI